MKNVIMLVAMLVLLAACGGSDETAMTSAEPTAVAEQAETADSAAQESDAGESGSEDAAATADDPTQVRDRDWKYNNAADPVVTIIEYADYQCPACAGFAPVMKQLAEAHPENVEFIYRHFPLSGIHPNARLAAEASEAAGAQGKFWEFGEILFDRQSEWSDMEEASAQVYFVSVAEELGLNTTEFAAALDQDVYADYVIASEEEAKALGLPGTPAAIVNGQVIPGEGLPRDFAIWDQFVREEASMRDMLATQYDAPPPMTIDENKQYTARVKMANGGEFAIELLPKSAPQTVNSFVFLSREGWFNGVTFHRVIPGFVAQTGDPTGTGRGGPGYTIPNEIDGTLSHNQKGVVAMANAGPDTNGSQWYITYGDVSQLDGDYSIFGRVIEGMEVVEAITPRDPAVNPSAPAGDVIESITIEEN